MQMAEFRNHVLSILTRDEIALLSPLRLIELHTGDYLLHAGDRVEQVVFPESGVVSLITGIGGGSAIEIAMIGREGLVGSSVIAGNGGATTDLLVQVSGNGYTVPRSRFLHAVAQSSRLSTCRWSMLLCLHRRNNRPRAMPRIPRKRAYAGGCWNCMTAPTRRWCR
jgi:CRP-like cAMP-binding protein